jgi:hypothetical protein
MTVDTIIPTPDAHYARALDTAEKMVGLRLERLLTTGAGEPASGADFMRPSLPPDAGAARAFDSYQIAREVFAEEADQN